MDALKRLQQTIYSFHQLPLSEWEKFCEILLFEEYKKGDYLTRQGQPEHNLYFIITGATRNYFFKEDKEFTVAFHFAGEFVTAFYSLITGEPSVVNIEFIEDAEVIVIPYNKLLKFYETSKEGATVGRKMAEYQYAFRLKKEMELLSLTAEERYIQLLEKNPTMVAAISVKHLSSYLGVQPESLSRIRRQLSKN